MNPHPCGHLRAVPEFTLFSRLPLARLPMVGPWFSTPWRLVSQSHGAVAWRFLSPTLPCSDWFATPRCPVLLCDFPLMAHSPLLMVSRFQGAGGRPLPHPFPCAVPPSHPSSRAYTPQSQSTGWNYHKLVSVVLALSKSIAAQAGIHQHSRGWIQKDSPPASASTRGDQQVVDALCIMTLPLLACTI